MAPDMPDMIDVHICNMITCHQEVPNKMRFTAAINILRVGASTLAGEGVRPASVGILR